MVFTAPMSCRSHSINNINIIRIFAWDIGYCMQLVIGRAKRALCSSWLNNRRLGNASGVTDGGETRSLYPTPMRAVEKKQRE